MGSYHSEKENHEVKAVTSERDETTLSAMVLGATMVFPAVLNAAIELNLFEIIAKGSSQESGGFMSALEIASKLPTQHPDMPNRLERVLRLLVSYSLLTISTRTNEDGSVVGVYGVSPIGRYLVNDENGDGYLGSFHSFLCQPALLGVW